MPKVALVQFAPHSPSTSHPADSSSPSSNFSLNLSKAHRFVRQAAKQGAELICFPEYFLSGVVADKPHWTLSQYPSTHSHLHDDHPNVSDSPPSTTTHWLTTFQSLAKELEVDIAVGTIVERQIDPKTGLEVKMKVKIEGEEEEEEERMVLNNVAYYVGSDGDIKGRYVKRNLWWPEKEYLTSSESDDEHKVFETRFGRTSFLICWDLAHGSSFLPLLSQSVDLIICPTYWTNSDGGPQAKRWDQDSEKKWLESLIVSRAFENECGIIFVNVGASKEGENEEERIGCSAVCLPFKGKIGGTSSEKEEMVLVDMDLEVLKDARAVYGMRRGLMIKREEKEEEKKRNQQEK